MCSRDGYIWKAWLGGQTHLKPPKFGENLRALSEAIGNPTFDLEGLIRGTINEVSLILGYH